MAACTTHPKFISLRKPFRKSYFWSKFWRLRFRREVVANTKLLRCNFVSLLLFKSNYEPRDSVDCSCGCLEGSSIFLETFIHLRVLIFVCGEGEVVGVMAWLVPFLCLCLCLFKPSNEPLNCSLCCLECQGIFLQSLILLRVHVCVCGEGEVSQSGFTVPRAQLLIPWYAALFVMLLAAPEGQSWKVGTVFWGSF